MRKKSLPRFFALAFLQTLASNMVHPVTPTFLDALGLPSSMFGAAFASMSLATLLFCPLWGRLGDRRGRVRMLSVSTLGYAAAQLLFWRSTTVAGVLLARFAGGFFAGGATVNMLAYVADASAPERRARNMAPYAALTSAATAAGFLAGGLVGNADASRAFLAQIALLVLCAVLQPLLLADAVPAAPAPLRLREADPFAAFAACRGGLDARTGLFLGAVFAACFASTAYDNAFNYYIKNRFAFPPSYNGFIYAAEGLIGLAVNLTVTARLQRRGEPRAALTAILAACALTLTAATFFGTARPFIAVNVLFYIFNSMYLPLQQAEAFAAGGRRHGEVSGLFTSVRAVGMVAGSLAAGLLYTARPLLPLYTAAAAFLAAAACSRVRPAPKNTEQNQPKGM